MQAACGAPPNDLVVKAAAKALRTFPALNRSDATDADAHPGVMQHDEINADKQDLSTIAGQIKDRAARAREGTIKQQELEGAIFQVSNLGMLDVLTFVSIITPPQVASLAVGTIRSVPVFRDEGQGKAPRRCVGGGGR